MEIVNVIEMEYGCVVSMSSYKANEDGIEEAETLFKQIGSRINPLLDDEDLESAVEDGFVHTKEKSVSLTWSTVE